MGDWALQGDGQRYESAGADTANSRGTGIGNGATANAKGSWTQLIASSSFNAQGIVVMCSNPTGFADEYLIDIGIGASGSEQVLIPNLPASNGSGSGVVFGAHYFFPIRVPSGTRISARAQSTTTFNNIYVHCILVGQSFIPSAPLSIVHDYGTDTSDSGGASIDPGTTANTKGSWTQLIASSDGPLRYLVMGWGNQNDSGRVSARWLFDIGIGASGSEQVLIPNIMLEAQAPASSINQQGVVPFPVHIPAGTRISARAQSNITTATHRLVDLIVYGVM